MEILSSRFLLHPADYARSVAFYRNIVGLHPMREFGSGDASGIVFFLGGGYLEITESAVRPPTEATELWLQVRDVEQAHERLKRAQVPIVEAPSKKRWGLIEMRVEDPDGLTLIFVEVPSDHPLRQDQRSFRQPV
jgi:catechol 2,3-dioxygenase-like lactoylglutathione lyase family enzyme